MNNSRPANLALLCAFAGLTACVSSGPTDRSGDEGPEVAGSDTVPPSVVMTGAAVAGTTETGEKLHCRRMTKPGSRIMHTVCMTEEQRRQMQEHAEQIRKGTDRRSLKSRTAR